MGINWGHVIVLLTLHGGSRLAALEHWTLPLDIEVAARMSEL